LTLNEKNIYNSLIECVVKEFKYIYNVKKRLVWVVLDIEEIRDDNENRFEKREE
tara:strand:- start:1081 stop:1242 length:162 start_codon:yes stop_codon:yes gene_type:complete